MIDIVQLTGGLALVSSWPVVSPSVNAPITATQTATRRFLFASGGFHMFIPNFQAVYFFFFFARTLALRCFSLASPLQQEKDL